MDQVLALIRSSRLVIADFTCMPENIKGNTVKGGVRGGVYWEAGFAFGLGKTVICTCQDDKDSRNRRHFDIDQYGTLFWQPDKLSGDIRNLEESILKPNFAEELAQHILGTIGKGNYKE
ncbi:MAG: hypothetical protein JXA46_14570 [Dehalococcoidales bacterium]|nr:hypothetical protein [Dehalococcoidales bacterium]